MVKVLFACPAHCTASLNGRFFFLLKLVKLFGINISFEARINLTVTGKANG